MDRQDASDRSLEIQSLFESAVSLEGNERAAFVAQVRAEHPQVGESLAALVAAHESHDTAVDHLLRQLRGGDPEDLWSHHPPEEPNDRIGRYRLLEVLGQGGMGVVWLAEQLEPVKRRVALKIVKLGMDTREVIGRFNTERQALAIMEHPNIARVLDAGATAAGRPYFVMEWVRGIPIEEYCDQKRLTIRDRIRALSGSVRGNPACSSKGCGTPRPRAFKHLGNRRGR